MIRRFVNLSVILILIIYGSQAGANALDLAGPSCGASSTSTDLSRSLQIKTLSGGIAQSLYETRAIQPGHEPVSPLSLPERLADSLWSPDLSSEIKRALRNFELGVPMATGYI